MPDILLGRAGTAGGSRKRNRLSAPDGKEETGVEEARLGVFRCSFRRKARKGIPPHQMQDSSGEDASLSCRAGISDEHAEIVYLTGIRWLFLLESACLSQTCLPVDGLRQKGVQSLLQ